MFSLEASTTLPYDPAAAFAALASVEASLRWQVGVLGVRRARAMHGAADAHPPGTLLVGYYALGVRHALRTRVTAYDPPAHFAYRAESAAFALDVALGFAPALGGAGLTYRLRLAVHPAADVGADPATAEQCAAALRRLLARRAPRDLARLERYLARRLRPAVALSVARGPAGQQTGDDVPAPVFLA